MAGLNVLTWLTAHLDACGSNNGKPLSGPDLERFLPWNADPEAPHLGTTALATTAAQLTPYQHAHPGVATRPRRHRHAPSQDFRVLTFE
jgi:hypothetical protein